MYLPMVPLLQIILFRTLPRPQAWFGVGLACVGMLLLSKPDGASLVIGHGAMVTVIGALAMAFEILLISRFANRGDLRRLALLQLVTVAVLATATALLFGEPVPQDGRAALRDRSGTYVQLSVVAGTLKKK